MKQQNKNIEELFKDKLHNFEADPGVNAWANVQAGISSGATSSSTATSGGSWASTVIVGIVITAVAVGGYFFFNNEGEKKAQPQEQTTEVSNIISEELQNNPTKEAAASETFKAVINDEAEEKASELANSTKVPNEVNQKVESKQDEQLDIIEPIVYEKTIDEILAEHQQFLDAQPTNSSQTETEQGATKTAEQPVTTNTSKQVNSTSVNSTNNTDRQIDLKKEQKRIADQVEFPNAFSPNLDGKNDVFQMTVKKSIAVDNLQVSILNKSGTVIGAFTGIYEGWNGKLLNGSFAPEDQYIYQAIIYVDGKQIPKFGSFTLTR